MELRRSFAGQVWLRKLRKTKSWHFHLIKQDASPPFTSIIFPLLQFILFYFFWVGGCRHCPLIGGLQLIPVSFLPAPKVCSGVEWSVVQTIDFGRRRRDSPFMDTCMPSLAHCPWPQKGESYMVPRKQICMYCLHTRPRYSLHTIRQLNHWLVLFPAQKTVLTRSNLASKWTHCSYQKRLPWLSAAAKIKHANTNIWFQWWFWYHQSKLPTSYAQVSD